MRKCFVKSEMGERKLNLNVPLLSVRRFSSPTRSSYGGENGKVADILPLYKPETPGPNMDQYTDPVAVPFVWEKTPGRCKDVNLQTTDSPKLCSRTKKNLQSRNPGNDKVGGPESEDDNDDEDAYTDALETLSVSDSQSMKWSVSSLSNSDDLSAKPSGTFSADPQTRSFMMNRFLPAAKAMALEQPQNASRKQNIVAVEEPEQLLTNRKPTVKEPKQLLTNRKPTVNHYVSSSVSNCSEEEQDGEEPESEDDKHENSAPVSTKVWGFIPRLCFKNSLCLINPVPRLKIPAKDSCCSTTEVGKPRKIEYRRASSPTAKKHKEDFDCKRKSRSRGQSPKRLEFEGNQCSGSNRHSFSSEKQAVHVSSSPLRRSISPYRNESPRSPFSERGFLGVPRDRLNPTGSSKSQELFVQSSNIPVVEKTLYVDTVQFARRPSSKSGPLDSMGRMNYMGNNRVSFPKGREMKEGVTSFHDVKSLKDLEKARKLGHNILGSSTSNHRIQANATCVGKKDACHDEGNENVVSVPPLPKTPSESWLWRTLPSVTPRNQTRTTYSGPQLTTKRQDQISLSDSSKWEAIVKSSYLHRDHVRYSEELITQVSQH